MRQMHMEYIRTNDSENEHFSYRSLNADSLESALSAMAYFLRKMGYAVDELRVDNPSEHDIIVTDEGDDRQ